MREIKFRAWDKRYEAMREVLTLSIVSEEVIVKTEGSMKARPWGQVEVMQYTGLKDKNGKEIYEGDLLRSVSTGFEPRPILEVFFGGGSYLLRAVIAREDTNLKSPQFLYTDWTKNYMTVIGNIYENKDLLS